ncbi:LL-H family phage holin [Lactobacillus colini]|uniref:LL-H family phage holin n=1 Tax=Lactobacillus colini TaxID=1819254 RepID=A0ABS4MBN7_9LACO|nr:phage holin [Lactobacillus colini]MBP2057028.1 LL-H family phage holin [Lactobacillus colini]
MNNILIDLAAVIVAISVSYGVFWYKKHQTEIDAKREKGDALAYTMDILGKLATNFVYDLKDSGETGKAKKQAVTTKVKSALGDAHLPIPSDAAISGAIEKAVLAMKLSEDKTKESEKNDK